MNRQEICLETVYRPGEPAEDLTVVRETVTTEYTHEKAVMSVSAVTAVQGMLTARMIGVISPLPSSSERADVKLVERTRNLSDIA
jgi:hypothetical protein